MKKYLIKLLVLSQLMFVGQAVADDAELLKARLSDLKSFTAAFSQTVKDEQGTAVYEAQGAITMTRPNKLRWETTMPDETSLIADGESVWHVDFFVEQVTVMSQQQAIENNPMVLLTSNSEAIWQQYSITQVDDNAFNVSPTSGNGQIRTLTVQFDDAGLAGLVMIDSQQQQSVIQFTNRKFNAVISPEQFTVAVPDGFMLDDQRS